MYLMQIHVLKFIIKHRKTNVYLKVNAIDNIKKKLNLITIGILILTLLIIRSSTLPFYFTLAVLTYIDCFKFEHSSPVVHFQDIYHVIILTSWRSFKTHRTLET